MPRLLVHRRDRRRLSAASAAEVRRGFRSPRPATEPPPAAASGIWADRRCEVALSTTRMAAHRRTWPRAPRRARGRAGVAVAASCSRHALAPGATPSPIATTPELAPPVPLPTKRRGRTPSLPASPAPRARRRVRAEDPPIDDGGGCLVAQPLSVTALGSGVAIGPETILDCATTESLAALDARTSVVPAATRTARRAPTKIDQDSAYVCRNRYNDPHAKISEHAHANAIDIAAFEFAGREHCRHRRERAGLGREASFEAADPRRLMPLFHDRARPRLKRRARDAFPPRHGCSGAAATGSASSASRGSRARREKTKRE